MKNKTKEFYNSFVSVLKKDGEGGNLRHQHVFKRFDDLLSESKTVLDLGCGLGLTTGYLRGLGKNALGVDLSPELLSEAVKKYGNHFLCRDVLGLDLKKSFDAITLIDSIEHLPRQNMNKIFDIIEHHSKDGTLVYINIPHARYQRYIQKNRADLLQIIDEDIDSSYIIKEMEKKGFELKLFNAYGLWEVKEFNYAEFLFVKFSEGIEEGYFKCLKDLKIKK
jgi:2-polyprenyl-3-methyl-5-hydroxy-6-metoxy-1,4-benzoquinol methylase